MGISHIPIAQHHIGSFVANMVSQKLGTHITIGRVDPGFLNRIIIEDLSIWDQQKKEMVRVARLSAKIDLAPLITDGKISISSAQLFGAYLTLYRQNAQTAPNFQFALDSLASKDTTSHTPLDLRINTLIIRHTNFSYNQLDAPKTEGIFNPAHLNVSNLNANINLKVLTDDSLNVSVKRFGCSEQSGLTLSRLAFHLEAGRQQAFLSQLCLEMPSSQIQIDTLRAAYMLDDKGIKPGSISFNGNIRNTSITPSDLRCFDHLLKNFQRSISLTTTFSGSDSGLSLKEFVVNTEEKDIDIRANGWIQGYNKQPSWHLQLDNLTFADTSLDFLTKVIPQIPSEITRLGSIQMNGLCNRSPQGAGELKTNIRSGVGDIDVQIDMNANQQFSGHINTDGINLRQLLNDTKFGTVATNIAVSGQLKKQQKPDIAIDGIVKQFDYNGYSYSQISLNGNYANNTITGAIGIDDPHVDAQLQGELTDGIFTKNTKKPASIKLQGSINHLAPAAIHLTDQWGEAVMSGDIDANFTASNINDALGDLHISHFNFSATEDAPVYHLDELILTSGYDEGIHFVTLKSDFAEAELRGQFDSSTLTQSITSAIGSKLPTLPGLPKYNRQADNNFSLRLNLFKTDWLKRFLGVNLSLQQPLSLQARVNDNTRELYLDGEFPRFTYNGDSYSNGNIRIISPADTMKCDASITKLMENGHNLDMRVLANASNNNLTTSLRWDNHFPEKKMSGELNTIMQLYQNFGDVSEAHVRVLPSHVILNNSTLY